MNEIDINKVKGGMTMKIGFIGAGKVGVSLGKYFADNNQEITGYYSKFEKDAIEAAEFTNSQVYRNQEDLVKDSEMLFVTVPDGVIEKVWNQVKTYDVSGKIICHASGALSSEVFSDISELKGFGFSIHPLFAVSDKYNSYKELSGSYFTIEGSEQKINVVKSFLEKMGNNVCIISKNDKVKYHASAAIASNLVVGLISLSERLLTECGFDEKSAHEALAPIIKGNVNHIINDGVTKALTGPIERNDITTVKKHLEILDDNDKEIYKRLSLEVVNVAEKKNKDRDYSKIKETLK